MKCIQFKKAKQYHALVLKLKSRGISSTFLSANSPQSNRLAERMNRTLLKKTRGLLKCTGIKKGYWSEAVLHATYVYNQT